MRFMIGLLVASQFLAPSVGFAKTVDVSLKVEKVGEVIHWNPESFEVSPGDKLVLHAENSLVGGADFHGLFIPQLKISEKVDRNKPVTIKRNVPKSLKPGVYSVSCQFHPKHVPARLVVTPVKAKNG